MQIRGQAAHAAKQPLQPFSYEPGELGAHEVEIRIQYCGICHSDIHLIDGDWEWSSFPFIPGHEIIGTVNEVGKAVTHLKAGQRVGVGWQSGSCRVCEWCIRGEENLCPQSEGTCVGRHGGFAEAVRLGSRFVFPIPDALDSQSAAPLMCAGITVYTPLRDWGVAPPQKVGVAGIGGLGHLAVRFAAAFGCEVTAFSTSADKLDEAARLGAHRFVLSSDGDEMAKAAGSLDFIIATPYTGADWVGYVTALRPKGTLCIVGADPAALNVPPGLLLLQHKRICGSIIGNRSAIQEMLAFAARHGIGAKTELMPLSQANAAIEKVRAGKARYRMVLKA